MICEVHFQYKHSVADSALQSYHVHVYRLHALRIHDGQAASDKRAPVAALHNILFVTQPAHDLVHHLCVVDMLEPFLVGIRREAVAR